MSKIKYYYAARYFDTIKLSFGSLEVMKFSVLLFTVSQSAYQTETEVDNLKSTSGFFLVGSSNTNYVTLP